MKLSVDRCLYFFLFINPLLSLALDGTTVRYFYFTLPIIYVLATTKVLMSKEYRKAAIIMNLISFAAIIAGLLKGGDYGKINNHLFNFLSAMMLMLYISVPKDKSRFLTYVKRHINTLIVICMIIDLVELYMLISRKGYSLKWSWGGYYYRGSNSMPHTMAYLMLCTLFMSVCIIIIKQQVVYMVLAIIPIYCIAVSGVRVVLVPVGAFFVVFLDIIFSKKSKSTFLKFIKAVIILGVLALVFYDQIFSSTMMTKILNRMASSSVTSGRIDIWIYLLEIFANNFKYWILGMGDQNIYYYNSIHPVFHNEIWAHSDLIQVLVGKGILCLICYIYAFKEFIRSGLERKRNYYSLLIYGSVLFLVAFNGFYNYRDMMLAIPFITTTVYLLNNEWFLGSNSSRRVRNEA